MDVGFRHLAVRPGAAPGRLEYCYRASGKSAQQVHDHLSLLLLAFLNVVERLGQQIVEPGLEQVGDLTLSEGLGLVRLVLPSVRAATVLLLDRLDAQRTEVFRLLGGDGDPLPRVLVERAVQVTFLERGGCWLQCPRRPDQDRRRTGHGFAAHARAAL